MTLFADRYVTSRILAGMVTLFAMMVSSPSRAMEPKARVTIAEGVGKWVVHEKTGRVFASLIHGTEVVEYDSNAKEVTRFKVGLTPTEMILKGDFLIVACTKSPALHVIDLKTNKSLGMIALNGKGPYALFCSQVDNSYVYCMCNTGDAWWDGEVFQCDLLKLQIRKQTKIQGWRQSHVIHVAMSADGRWIVPDARGASSPSGADLMKVNEDELTFLQMFHHHSSFGQIVAVPGNRYWTLGKDLFSLDISQSVRSFEGSPVIAHPERDLAVSLAGASLALERFTDSSPIARLTLNVDTKPKSGPNVRRTGELLHTIDPTLQFDLKNNLVFFGDMTSGQWFELNEYADQIKPIRQIHAPSEVNVMIDTALRVPVLVTNGGGSTSLVISEGPKSAKLDDGFLIWQPQAEHIGLNTFQIKFQDGDQLLDTAVVTVHVQLPKVEFDFNCKTMELAPGNRYLIVWGPTKGQDDRHPAHTGPDDAAVVDLQERKILGKATFPQGIRCATIDDEFVYISPQSGNLVNRYDRMLKQNSRVFLQTAPVQMFKISLNRLAVIGGKTEFIDTETMKVAADSASLSFDPTRIVLAQGDQYVQQGDHIIDMSTGGRFESRRQSILPSLVPVNPRAEGAGLATNISPTRWGRRLNGLQLSNYKGIQITSWPHETIVAISELWPVAVVIQTIQDGQAVRTSMGLANLVDGTVEHTYAIDVSTDKGTRDLNFYGQRNRLILAEEKVLLLRRNELLLASIPKLAAKTLRIPTHFSVQPSQEVEVGKSLKWKLGIAGESEGVTFNLLAEYPGLELNSESGELNIETSQLWTDFVRTSTRKTESFDNRGQPVEPLTAAANSKAYKSMTGKDLPPDRIAAQLPIVAVLHDSEGQEDGVRLSVIVVGPRKDFDDALAANKAEVAEQARLNAKRQGEQAAKMAAEIARQKEEGMLLRQNPPLKGADGNLSVEDRLDAMDTRMRRIEAALDAVLRRLDEHDAKRDAPK